MYKEFENSNDAKQVRQKAYKRMQELIDLRKKEGRDWSKKEESEYETENKQFDLANDAICSLEDAEEREWNRINPGVSKNEFFARVKNGMPNGDRNMTETKTEFYDKRTEKPVKVFQRSDRFADHFSAENPDKLSVGKAIRGLISGDWSNAENEKRSLATGSNGGLLVPLSVFANVIDMARAKSVAVQSGAQFLPMSDGNMSLVRVSNTTGFESKVENEAFSGGAVAFDPVNLKAHTLGTYVTLSRELAADAVNVAQAVEQALAGGIADFLDKMIFVGSGDGQPLGLLNNSNINEVETTGAVSYAHILRAWSLAKTNNADDLSLVSNPDLKAQFANLYESNSGFVSPPELIAALRWYASSNMPANLGLGEDETAMIVGDFSKLIIGIRENAMIEVSHNAGDFFAKHQTGVKVTLRADFTPMYDKHFSKITKIVPAADWWDGATYPVVGGSES